MNRLGQILGWVFGVMFTMGGIAGLLFAGGGLASFFVLLAGVIILPPVKKGLESISGQPVPGWALGVLTLILLLVAQAVETPGSRPRNQEKRPGVSEAARKKAAQRRAQAPKPQKRRLLRVSAGDLKQTYDANEIAADNQYKNKRFIVYGEIDQIREDWGAPNVVLKAGSWGSVLCRCKKDQKNRLAQFQAGEQIALAGVCQGVSLAYVGFHDCRVVE